MRHQNQAATSRYGCAALGLLKDVSKYLRIQSGANKTSRQAYNHTAA